MTKMPVLAAAALISSMTLAAAQPAPPPAPPAPQAGQDGAAPDQPMRERMRDGMRGEGRGGMMREMMAHRMGGMMGGPRLPRAARFTFERDGATVDLRCAENETTRACVDAAAVLLDKLTPQPGR